MLESDRVASAVGAHWFLREDSWRPLVKAEWMGGAAKAYSTKQC
jgi:hypothetical protein